MQAGQGWFIHMKSLSTAPTKCYCTNKWMVCCNKGRKLHRAHDISITTAPQYTATKQYWQGQQRGNVMNKYSCHSIFVIVIAHEEYICCGNPRQTLQGYPMVSSMLHKAVMAICILTHSGHENCHPCSEANCHSNQHNKHSVYIVQYLNGTALISKYTLSIRYWH